MALVINKQLETRDGYLLEPGLYIKFTTTFPPSGDMVIFSPQVWINKAAHDAGSMPMIFPPELLTTGFTKMLTPSDYDSLTPNTVHQFFKEVLEEVLQEDVSPQVEFVEIVY